MRSVVVMPVNLTRLRLNTVSTVFWISLTLVLLASYTHGQANNDSTTGRARRTRPPPSVPTKSSKVGPPAGGATVKTIPAPVPVTKPPARPTAADAAGTAGKATAAAAGTAPKSAAVAAGDADQNDIEEQTEEYEQNGDDDLEVKPMSTRPPLSSIVTAPMPRIPLETVFMAAGQPKEAPCVAVKAGIRFTFNYANVSSGKVEQGSMDLPTRNYTIDGHCGQTRQRMSLIFSPDRQVSPESAVEDGTAWNLTLTFVRNGSEIFAERLSLRYIVQTGHLPFPWSVDASMTAVLQKPGLFHIPDDEHSFICMSDAGYGDFVLVADDSNLAGASAPAESPSVGGGSVPGNTSLQQPLAANVNQSVRLQMVEFYNLQLQAFLKPPQQPSSSDAGSTPVTISFSTRVVQCSGDFISVRIPVILGIILLVFVIAVVAVYMTRRLMHGKQTDEKRKSVDYRAVH